MKDLDAFVRLATALKPWQEQLVFVGGWAHRLYRLHPKAQTPNYQPPTTRDADIAFGDRERIEGSIKDRLEAAGFQEELKGSHQPPVTEYHLGAEGGGFYAEFLVPLIGRSSTKSGKPLATLGNAGITAQRIRYLDVLLIAPWDVPLQDSNGLWQPLRVRVPNPVSFMLQKLLIRETREPIKQAQDVLYIHDTLELFADHVDELGHLWRQNVRPQIQQNWVDRIEGTMEASFARLDDRTRDAAAIPIDRNLAPESVRRICYALLREILG